MQTQIHEPKTLTPAPPWLRAAAALSAVLAGWWLMMAVHELGHVLGAWASGGHVGRVELPLFGFSRTELTHNPSPLTVVWAGPVLGVLLPTAVWAAPRLLVSRGRARHALPPATAFAGFCLVTNGLYLGLGWIDRVGDAGDMLRLGTPTAMMIGFGVVSCFAGLALWHTLGPWLGLRAITTRSATRLLVAGACVIALSRIVPLITSPAQ